ncbi:protein shuttle craft [Dendroctonus ponderosae]|uniref:protein shuttle craft n=1 Tax=Dendroctonus ponderosae TaxID=77166 RepID=UPI002036191E|nr:protein shuttle craft [Dendroctonus ponderosae]KAH1026829.1 hypothetical protein HUJ05_000442 [Dendroctonus ponderosae]
MSQLDPNEPVGANSAGYFQRGSFSSDGRHLSRGAIKKKFNRYNQALPGPAKQLKPEINGSSAQLNATAPEFVPSGSATKRDFQERSWRDRSKSRNWRNSDMQSMGDRARHSGSNSFNPEPNEYREYNNWNGRENSAEFGNNPSSYRYDRPGPSATGFQSKKTPTNYRTGYVNNGYHRPNRFQGSFSNNHSADGGFEKRKFPDRKNSGKSSKLYPTTAGQRERLTEMIVNNLLECLVCCEKIKRSDGVWSCSQCYHIIHLTCTVAWAKSSKVEENWRCPACQNSYAEVPHQYTCYCGKCVQPRANPTVLDHGCGSMCLRIGKSCAHKCNIVCHPGPCPECSIMVSKSCGCGATQQMVKCCSNLEIICDATCNKLLNCGLHRCEATCHAGACQPCAEMIVQECYCGVTGRKVACDEAHVGQTRFSCQNTCGKLLPCGNHYCPASCHSGPCGLCPTDVDLIKFCHCGKTELQTARLSCLDSIPCCANTCGKRFICGPPSKPHTCVEKCHEGECAPCPLTTVLKCRCGHMDKEVACQKLTTKADDARCEKKCTKKRLCGKHTCKQKCCIEFEHICRLPCNKLLTCGLHKCELTCHSGRCPACMETSFDELYCECGASVLFPPIRCGTKLPACKKQCSKPRACGHDPNHECHPGPCPPCFVLTKQWCYGHHEQRAVIPCHQSSFGCGLPCGKQMPCGRHRCTKACHEGDCPLPCSQPCSAPRTLCGHPCSKPCHDSPCPESNCWQMVPVTCLCGLQKASKSCMELTEEFRRIEMAQLKDRLSHMMSNASVDLQEASVRRPAILKVLECNEECRVLDRNRRLAIGLQILNPDLSQKLTPRYSDFLRQWGKKDGHFCQKVHDKLTELVQLAKQSKQKSRSYSFESMNRDKRKFIHEYCEHFGVESAAYDAEPNRNVVATAVKDKSWLPSLSLLESVRRENGHRKIPLPTLGHSPNPENEIVSLKLLTSTKKD